MLNTFSSFAGGKNSSAPIQGVLTLLKSPSMSVVMLVMLVPFWYKPVPCACKLIAEI